MEIKLLEKLIDAVGVSGYEDEVAELIQLEMEKYADEVKRDKLGNIIGIKRGNGKGTVMLAAHMDEIGFVVSHIDKDGFIFVSPVGGINVKTLISRRVFVHGDKKYSGIMGSVPPHVKEKEEKKDKKLSIEDIFVDIGAKSKEEVLKKGIDIGTIITYDESLKKLSEGRYTSKSMDDRIGVFLLLETLKKVESPYDLYFVATTQEEVGLRGAKVSGYEISPDMGIAVDVTLAMDLPEVKEHKRITELGKGPAITVMDRSIISHRKLNALIEKTAEEEKIPLQKNILTRGGTDAGAIHLTREGVPSTTLSIPTRFVHSTVECVDMGDVENGVNLLVKTLEREDLVF
ncbi:MAG: M42 family metallopeptidase [Euryarchaeota archaeon]|nr:M42 family metallopeptidase [Euryarchaeota archaeon]